MEPKPAEKSRTFTEEIEVLGGNLINEVKSLLAEGKVRQIRIKASDGEVYVEMPMTIGVIAGGVVVLAAPWLAMLSVLAALVTKVRIEIVREVEDDSKTANEAQTGAQDETPKAA